MLDFNEKIFSVAAKVNPEGRNFFVVSLKKSDYTEYNSMGYSLSEATDGMIKLLGDLGYFEEI